jgi:hypothetical protein
MKRAYSAGSGRGMPGGGIMLACSLRIMRSPVSACSPIFAKSKDVSVRLAAAILVAIVMAADASTS